MMSIIAHAGSLVSRHTSSQPSVLQVTYKKIVGDGNANVAKFI